jgi:putative SOS response-associated peptidase YedK
MCYHYALWADKPTLEERYTNELIAEYDAIYHNDGFSHRAMPVITADEPTKIQLYNWGLIPHWFKPEIGKLDTKGSPISALKQAWAFSNQTLNAVGETVFDKPSFRNYVGKKRCLIPANGIYEWHHLDAKTKIPHYIYLKSKQIFSFGGIYSHWVDPETGEVIKTYAILTNPAQPTDLMGKIHNSKLRQPFILKRDVEGSWLDQDLVKDDVRDMILPMENTHFTAHTISKLITSRTESSNVPEVMDPCKYEGFVSLTDEAA